MSNHTFPETPKSPPDTPHERTYVFPWRTPPLHANQRLHWAVEMRLKRDVRFAARHAARHFPDVERIQVSLVWVVADRRRRDGGENLGPLLKPLIDGLVDAEVVEDDTQELVTRIMPVIRYEKGATPHFELTVREVLA